MRKVVDEQLIFGETEISKITFDPKSRDDIPQLLKGLQYIYMEKETREKIFEILEKEVSPNIDKENGRPGMTLWKILVMGVLRLDLNWDYDRLHEMVNNHQKIREMLGHGLSNEKYTYNLQTLKDNVKLLTPEVLNKINDVVVECGHKLVKKKDLSDLKARCDTFVVETNVHYPTDTNLLYDATRKVISLTAALCKRYNISGWRQSAFNIKQLKRQLFKLQKLKRSSSKDAYKAHKKMKEISAAYRAYTNAAKALIEKAKIAQQELALQGADPLLFLEIDCFTGHAERQIDQIIRRVIEGEEIPHEEKVFSVFESHTEWISKGKAGVPVELGLRVAVIEDEFGFFLNHKVMEKQTDDQIAISFISDTKKKFPELKSCSFDKGFHSSENQEELRKILDVVALPKKGKLSKKDIESQHSKEFKSARKKHSAVESAINALEVHGLDRCPDHGLYGFKRYVSLAVLARNIQIVGAILIKRERIALKRLVEREKKREENYKIAA